MINNEHARISTRYLKNSHVSPGKICYLLHAYTVGYATTNECYDEQFLSIKSECYKKNTDATTNAVEYYRPTWHAPFIMESSIVVFTRVILFMLIIISSTNFNAQFSFVNNMFVTLSSSTCFEH